MQTKAMSTGFSLASCCASVTCSARTGTVNSGDVHGVGDAQPVLAHVLDMLGPGIDEGHVLAGLHHMRAGIAADRARSDDRDLPAHASPDIFLAADTTASAHPLQATLADRSFQPTGRPVPKADRCHAGNDGLLAVGLVLTPQVFERFAPSEAIRQQA